MASDPEPQTSSFLRDFTIDMVSGMAAGSINVLVGLPMDTIKVKMQTFPQDNPTVTKSLLRVARTDGLLRGLYAGAVPSLMANVGENAVLFVAYGQCQSMVARLSGLESSEQMTPVGNAISGSCAAVFSALWLCPTEHIKCQLQVRRELVARNPEMKMIGPYELTSNILKTEGVAGLFRGLKPTWTRELPGYFCFFLGYEGTKSLICKVMKYESKEQVTLPQQLLCGATAGVTFWTGIFPIDSVKSRIQVLGKTGSMREVAAGIMREHGLRGFYKGWVPAVLRAFPCTASLLATYEYVSSFLKQTL